MGASGGQEKNKMSNKDQDLLLVAKRGIAYPKRAGSGTNVGATKVPGPGATQVSGAGLPVVEKKIKEIDVDEYIQAMQASLASGGAQARGTDPATPVGAHYGESSAILKDAKKLVHYPKARSNRSEATGSSAAAGLSAKSLQSTASSHRGLAKSNHSESSVLQDAKRQVDYPSGRRFRERDSSKTSDVNPEDAAMKGLDSSWMDDEPQQEEPQTVSRTTTATTTTMSPTDLRLSLSNESPEQAQQAVVPVANMVEEEELSRDIQHAQDVVLGARNEHAQQTQKFKANVLVGVFLIICVIVVILLVVWVPQSSKTAPTEPPTGSPTLSPTSEVEYYLSLFPEDTVRSIEQGGTTPQALAFEWLLDDLQEQLDLTDERIKQRFVLATLYYATKGDTWLHNDNWLNHTTHECNWFTNDEFGQKALLSFLYPGIFKEVTYLPEARCDSDSGLYRHLWLDQNNLVGVIPPEFYSLTSLLSFSMSLTALSGTLSTQIGQLTALEAFGFSRMKNGGTIPSEVGLLKDLRVLALHNNNHYGSIPTEIWQLKNLSTLIVNHNNNIEGSLPTDMGNLSELRWLGLEESQLSGPILTEIGQLQNLEYLTLHQSRFTGTLPSELGQLTQATILSLYENNLEGTIPTEFGLMRALNFFTLEESQLTGPVPSEFGQLQNLTISLVLRENHLSGLIPSELGLLSSVGELSLQYNNFSGPVPSQIGDGQALYIVSLEGNPFLSGTLPTTLCTLNGTCIPNQYDPCEEPFGVTFECTDILCGCGCACASE